MKSHSIPPCPQLLVFFVQEASDTFSSFSYNLSIPFLSHWLLDSPLQFLSSPNLLFLTGQAPSLCSSQYQFPNLTAQPNTYSHLPLYQTPIPVSPHPDSLLQSPLHFPNSVALRRNLGSASKVLRAQKRQALCSHSSAQADLQ